MTASRQARPRPVTPAGILAERLGALVARVDEVDGAGGLGAAFANELRAVHRLAAGLEPYVEQCTSAPSAELRALAEATAAHPWEGALEQEMLSGHVEGRFLAMLVRISAAHRVLDLGMFTGYSALAMAEALPDHGVLVACELDAEVARLAGDWMAASPAAERIDIRVAPADETLRALARASDAPFDLVFLDADKPGYLGYVEQLLAHGLLPVGGLLCVDNTLLQGEPWATDSPGANGAAIAAFNTALADDDRVEQVLVPLRDGITLARRVR